MAIEALRVAAKESKIMKFVLGAFMLLAVGGLVFSSIGSYFTGNLGQTDVAKVGEVSISLSEFDRDLSGVLQQTGMPADEAYEAGIVNAYLDGRINNLLQLQAAQELKLYPDNALVAQQIQTMFGNMPRQQIEAMMRAQGMTEAGLADTIRASILTRYVTILPLSVANYVPDFVENADRKIQSERRDATVYKIPLTTIVENIQINDSQVQEYYQENIRLYTTPESRSFTIGIMTADMAKASLPEISEDDIRAAYEDQIDDFKVGETRSISQVVVKNPDIAQSIYEEALNGANLEEALLTITEDTSGYKEASSYKENGLPEELAEKVFAENIQVGDVTPPVKTLLGYTIMKVENITAEQLQSFEDVRPTLEKNLQQSQLYDALYNKMIETEDMIDAGQGFSDIAGATGLKTEPTNHFSENDLITQEEGILSDVIKASPAIIDELYSLPKGGVTYPLELDDTRYVVIGVRDITEETAMPIDTVKDDIITDLRLKNQQEAAKITLDEQLQNPEGYEPPSSAYVQNINDISRTSDNDFTDLLFSTSRGGYDYQITDDGYAVITTVTDIRYDDESDISSNELLIEQQRALIDSLLNEYYRQKFDVTVNEDLLRSTYSAESLQ